MREKRVALVIGNGNYDKGMPLKNPRNDARAVAEILPDFGFDVLGGTNGLDVGLSKFNKYINAFIEESWNADVALFYYAGHAVQVGGINYLLPIGVELENEMQVSTRLIDVQQILARIERQKLTNLVFLDACRNNPLARTLTRGHEQTRNAQIVQGQAGLHATDGTLIAFATASDQVAHDGAGLHSPFTDAFLEVLQDNPDQEIEFFLKDVCKKVVERTAHLGDGGQRPWLNASFLGRFRFGPRRMRASPCNLQDQGIAFPGQSLSGSFFSQTWKQPAVLKPEQSFRDASFAPEMIVVPAGQFVMGSRKDEKGHSENESPQHTVFIHRPFAVAKYPVTFEEWDACADAGGCSGYKPAHERWGRGRHPVIHVSWEDVQEYAKWLSDMTGREYRLLSEAEWEYAARAGESRAFSTGDTITRKQARFSEGDWGSAAEPWRLEATARTASAFTTCTAMPGNGWKTIGARIIVKRPPAALRIALLAESSASSVGVAGAIPSTKFAPPPGLWATVFSDATGSASGWRPAFCTRPANPARGK